jgi:hypothetical protein
MGQYQHLTYRVITMVRGGLISMLYRKMTDLSVRDVDPAASLTLMSADIERIVQGWQSIHEIWASALEIAVAIYLLQIQLGVSCAVPIGIAVGEFDRHNLLCRNPMIVTTCSFVDRVHHCDEFCGRASRRVAGSD